MKNETVNLSWIIPCFNEEKNIAPLFKEIVEVCRKNNYQWQIIWVNDGSRDGSQKEMEKTAEGYPSQVTVIQFRNNFGKAAAVTAGFKEAKGDLVVTIDGDGQDDPREITKFLAKIDEDYDLVVGWKQKRLDSMVKNKTSKFFNWVTNRSAHLSLHDHNCGFKVYRREVTEGLDLYGELHRYIPVMVARQGYRITEVPIGHRRRFSGKTKYGSIRFIHGFLDLLTVIFLTRYRARPLHLFGWPGVASTLVGLSTLGYLVMIKLFDHQSIGSRPLLLFGVMLTLMGVQFLAIGLVGEQITSLLHTNRTDYVVRKIINGKKD